MRLNLAWWRRLLMAMILAQLSPLGYAGSLTPIHTDELGVVANGYDVVAMFSNQLVEGSSRHSATHDGATYHFASDANQEAFTTNPNKYIPAYGGFCAYGVRMGQMLGTDPSTFIVRGGKLYLMLNAATKRMWEGDINRNIKIANRLWPGLKGRSSN